MRSDQLEVTDLGEHHGGRRLVVEHDDRHALAGLVVDGGRPIPTVTGRRPQARAIT